MSGQWQTVVSEQCQRDRTLMARRDALVEMPGSSKQGVTSTT